MSANVSVAKSRDGSRVVPDPAAARLLRLIGRGRSDVSVGPIALERLLAPLFVFLADMAQTAAQSRRPLYLRCGPALP